jgi:hypothetical protein
LIFRHYWYAYAIMLILRHWFDYAITPLLRHYWLRRHDAMPLPPFTPHWYIIADIADDIIDYAMPLRHFD